MTLLEALTYAFGKEVQFVDGRPVTRTTGDFAPADTELNVHSTLGFPSAGVVWLYGREFQYTGKTDTSFTGIDAWRPLTIPRGSYVVSATRRLLPEAYELFWPNSPAAAEFYGTSYDLEGF